jgi:hypothetical protein
MIRLAAAALLLLATIGTLVAVAAWNRRVEVQAIELTERELGFPWAGSRDGAREIEPNLRLRLQWQPRSDPQDARLWLTDDRLRALGFETAIPAGAPEAEAHYGRSLPRIAWVALELDGPAWRDMERRLAISAERFDPNQYSRLVPVDADPDREALVRRHTGEPVIVLPAVVRMRYRLDPTRGPSVWATVESLALADLSVPLGLRNPLRAPHYRVRLAVGRLGLPWIASVR